MLMSPSKWEQVPWTSCWHKKVMNNLLHVEFKWLCTELWRKNPCQTHSFTQLSLKCTFPCFKLVAERANLVDYLWVTKCVSERAPHMAVVNQFDNWNSVVTIKKIYPQRRCLSEKIKNKGNRVLVSVWKSSRLNHSFTWILSSCKMVRRDYSETTDTTYCKKARMIKKCARRHKAITVTSSSINCVAVL